MTSRGLRNNNPGNIRHNGFNYEGEKALSTDKAFKQFISSAYGYRAMFVILYTYQKKHGLTTLGEFINRYAPPTENKTDNYISIVCKRSHLNINKPLNTLNRKDMIPVVSAMSYVENGLEAISKDVEIGWTLFRESYA